MIKKGKWLFYFLLALSSINAFGTLPEKVHLPIRIKPNTTTLVPTGLTPNQVRNYYGFNKISYQGAGQTIALVEAYDHPTIESDLNVFSNTFGLPPCTTANGCFKKVYVDGIPSTDQLWGIEISLDVEWAHAIAPQAKILLVETTTNLFNGVTTALQQGANVISMSWGWYEFSDEVRYDHLFNVPNVMFVAASGDNGTGGLYPAFSPYVLAVGGTRVATDGSGNYLGETAWSGSGGGLSKYESEPSFQRAFPIPNSRNMRGIPDVAYDADPLTGFAIYDTLPYNGHTGWFVVGGTSAGAPQWSALIAIANSAMTPRHVTIEALYQAAKTNYAANYHDITSGSNGNCGYYCNAMSGYDYVTGLGSPQAQNLINNLIGGPSGTAYDYWVYVGYPFSPVVINYKITCPDPNTHNPACLVQNQAVQSVMLITGSNNHVCHLTINNDGSVSVNSSNSNYCNINSTPAKPHAAGSISLPSGF